MYTLFGLLSTELNVSCSNDSGKSMLIIWVISIINFFEVLLLKTVYVHCDRIQEQMT